MRETPEEGFDARDEILDRIEVRSSTARVPGQTSMDRHIKAAETERVRLHKNRLCSGEGQSDIGVSCHIVRGQKQVVVCLKC